MYLHIEVKGMFQTVDPERRIARLENLVKIIDREETDVIGDYEREYGSSENWAAEIQNECDLLLCGIQQARMEIQDTINNIKR